MKEYKVEFSPEALTDLRNLYDWIADAAGATTALGYIERLETYCQGMRHAAERGHTRNDIRKGLRIVGFEKRVTIAFSVKSDRVTILRLFYGGRNWEEIM